MEVTLIIITATLTSLLAGLYFGYAVSVNWALHRLKDAEYVRAMQAIDVAIQNPLFFLTFMGPVVLLPIITFMSQGNRFTLLLIASIAYIVGSFLVTIGGNVPMNERLARVNADGNQSEVARARAVYEKPWNRLHAVRTVASIAATVLVISACFA